MSRVKGRSPRPRGHRPPADFAPPLIEGTLAEMAAEAGTTEAEFLAGLDEFEAARHLVMLATDDPGTVRFFLVLADDYDRMRAAADFLATPEGRDLEEWHDAWRHDPRLNDDAREALEAITAAVIAGGGTGRIGDDVFTIGGDHG